MSKRFVKKLETRCRSVDPREPATRAQGEAEGCDSDAGDAQDRTNLHRRDVSESDGRRDRSGCQPDDEHADRQSDERLGGQCQAD
jgi:hypothetical protein